MFQEQEQKQKKQQEKIESYILSANNSTENLRYLCYVFVLVGLYLIAVFIGVNDEQLLIKKPILLPIIRLETPLLDTFIAIPVLYFLLHLVILLQFYLLSCKLHELKNLLNKNTDKIHYTNKLSDFMLGHFILVDHGLSITIALKFLLIFTIMLLPMAVLIFIAYVFVPYHSKSILYFHGGVLFFCVLSITYFWYKIFYAISQTDNNKTNKIIMWTMLSVPAIFFILSIWFFYYISDYDDIEYSNCKDKEFLFFYPHNKIKIQNKLIMIRNTEFQSNLEQGIRDDKDKKFLIAVKEANPITIETRNLKCADLSGSILPRVVLKDVHFEGAKLDNTKFYFADFTRVYFNNALMKNSILNYSKAIESDFSHADMENAELHGVNFGVTDNSKVNKFMNSNLINANLEGADISGAFMPEVLLENAKLNYTTMRKTWLTNAHLNGAKFHGADLEESILIGANLQYAEFYAANLQKTYMIDSLFDISSDDRSTPLESKFGGADFTNATLGKVHFGWQRLAGANIEIDLLGGAESKKDNFEGVNFNSTKEKDKDDVQYKWTNLYDVSSQFVYRFLANKGLSNTDIIVKDYKNNEIIKIYPLILSINEHLYTGDDAVFALTEKSCYPLIIREAEDYINDFKLLKKDYRNKFKNKFKCAPSPGQYSYLINQINYINWYSYRYDALKKATYAILKDLERYSNQNYPDYLKEYLHEHIRVSLERIDKLVEFDKAMLPNDLHNLQGKTKSITNEDISFNYNQNLSHSLILDPEFKHFWENEFHKTISYEYGITKKLESSRFKRLIGTIYKEPSS